jgi:hypothetical protein
MVRNALRRGWNSEDVLEIALCDDELRKMVHELVTT